jgi:hypothetical protein
MSVTVDHIGSPPPPHNRSAFRNALGPRGSAAISMPAALGSDVLAVLKVRLMVGPVVAHRLRPCRWTFLTGPPIAVRDQVKAEPARHQVELSAATNLSVATTEPGQVRWIEPVIAGRALPPWSAVVAAIRTVAAAHG